MTCIVAIAHGGKVYVGADSAGVCGLDLRVRADRKVFANGDFLMGFTTSFRMGQLLQHSLSPPKRRPDRDVLAFMSVEFVDAIRECLKHGGFAKKSSEQEEGGDFIVGYAGRIFTVHGDYQVAECSDSAAAVGCGSAYALGALFANRKRSPRERVKEALLAAEAHSAGVRGPFYIESRVSQ